MPDLKTALAGHPAATAARPSTFQYPCDVSHGHTGLVVYVDGATRVALFPDGKCPLPVNTRSNIELGGVEEKLHLVGAPAHKWHQMTERGDVYMVRFAARDVFPHPNHVVQLFGKSPARLIADLQGRVTLHLPPPDARRPLRRRGAEAAPTAAPPPPPPTYTLAQVSEARALINAAREQHGLRLSVNADGELAVRIERDL